MPLFVLFALAALGSPCLRNSVALRSRVAPRCANAPRSLVAPSGGGRSALPAPHPPRGQSGCRLRLSFFCSSPSLIARVAWSSSCPLAARFISPAGVRCLPDSARPRGCRRGTPRSSTSPGGPPPLGLLRHALRALGLRPRHRGISPTAHFFSF